MLTQPLTVLLTNLFVANHSGSETVTELYADGLRRAGHRPIVYAPHLGPQADRMRERGHVLIDRMAALPARPDVIHAHHGPPAMAAIAALPGVPVVYMCHSAQFEVEAPPDHPQIRRIVAVDDLCRDRCLARGVEAARLSVELNPIDPERLHIRGPLPRQPARALLLAKNRGHQEAVRDACMAAGIALEELGPASGRISTTLAAELPNYDLVFATARMALEAAAAGCAVIVCDARGFAGLLTEARLESWRRLNFGAGLLARPITVGAVRDALAEYDAGDAERTATRIRKDADLAPCIERLVAVYRGAMAEPRADAATAADALVRWLEDSVPTSQPRAWMAMAREVSGMTQSTMETPLLAAEDRLGRQMDAHFATMATRISAMDAGLRAAVEGRVADAVAQLGPVVAAGHSASLSARTGRLIRAIYRRMLPLPIRRPLHRLRHRLLRGN